MAYVITSFYRDIFRQKQYLIYFSRNNCMFIIKNFAIMNGKKRLKSLSNSFFVKYIYWSPNIILQITFTYGYKITNFTQMQILKLHTELHVLSLLWRPFWYLVIFALSVLTGFWGRLICSTITVWIHCSCVFTLSLFMSVIYMVFR